MRSSLKRALALSALLGVSAPVHAQEPPPEPSATERAAVEYDAGVRAFESREYERAARAFERADAIAPHARTRYNAALSWDRAGDAPRAADAYSSALQGGGLDQERLDAARARLGQLTKKIGAIDVRRPEGGKVSVAHVTDALIPVRVHVMPGRHRLELTSADGTRQQRDVEVVAGERVVLEIAITSVPLAPAARRAPAPRPAVRESSPDRAPESDSGSANTTWGIALLGGAAVFAGGAVFFGIQTADSIDEFDRSGDRDAAARDRAVRYRALSWAAGGAALACGTIGIVLLASGDDGDVGRRRAGRNAGSRFELGLRGTAAEARWRF